MGRSVHKIFIFTEADSKKSSMFSEKEHPHFLLLFANTILNDKEIFSKILISKSHYQIQQEQR